MKKLKEDRFDKLEYMYIDGSYALIRKYEQGPFLKKILNGNVFDRLYRYVSAGKLKTKDNPFNVKNWKVGDDILLGLTSTLPFEDPKNLKKDLQVNFSYCMVFKDVKGYPVKYDTKSFTGSICTIAEDNPKQFCFETYVNRDRVDENTRRVYFRDPSELVALFWEYIDSFAE